MCMSVFFIQLQGGDLTSYGNLVAEVSEVYPFCITVNDDQCFT